MAASDDYEFHDNVIGERERDDILGVLMPGRYLVLDYLGEGGFCFVWLCYRFRDGTFWAVKVFHGNERSAAKREVRLMQRVGRVEGVVHMEETMEWGRQICVVYPLFGKPLCDQNSGSGVTDDYFLNYDTIASLATQVETAVRRLVRERSLIHADVRPENILVATPTVRHRKLMATFLRTAPQHKYAAARGRIKEFRNHAKARQILKKTARLCYDEFRRLLDADGNGDGDANEEDIVDSSTRVVLIDLGNAIPVTKQDEDIQSRYYQAPEVTLRLPYGADCDLWSLGCVLYELATNDVLFDPEASQGGLHCARNYLSLMESVLGTMPDHMWRQSPNRETLYHASGAIREHERCDRVALEDLLRDHLEDGRDADDVEEMVEKLPDLMRRYLQYTPGARVGSLTDAAEATAASTDA
jgi:serine/threonine-protein kinase SRPK3